MGSQMSCIGKIIGFFLLIVFTLQVTDLTCVDEGVSLKKPGTQSEVQIKADLDKGSSAYSPAGILDECQCPCHLNFSQSPSTEVSSYHAIVSSLALIRDIPLKKISADIFQPPKVLI